MYTILIALLCCTNSLCQLGDKYTNKKKFHVNITQELTQVLQPSQTYVSGYTHERGIILYPIPGIPFLRSTLASSSHQKVGSFYSGIHTEKAAFCASDHDKTMCCIFLLVSPSRCTILQIVGMDITTPASSSRVL